MTTSLSIFNSQHAFFGGEDCGYHTENFAACLRDRGWLVAGVNAEDAKKQRENVQASADRLDLLGIARMPRTLGYTELRI